MGDMQGHDMVLWIMRMIIVGFMVAVLIWFNFLTLKASYDTTKAEAALILNSLLSSQDGALQNINGRVYPVVDVTDFGKIDDGFYVNLTDHSASGPGDPDDIFRQRYMAFNVSVFDEANNRFPQGKIVNRHYYERWRVIADSGIQGSMGITRARERLEVIVFDGTDYKKGYLELDVLRQNQ